MTNDDQPSEGMLALIDGRWNCAILCKLMERPHRYGELHRALPPVSEKLLIQLQELEADGLVSRKAFPEIPPRVEYSLMDYGTTLRAPLMVLCEWAKKHVDRKVEKQGGAKKRSVSREVGVGASV